MSFLLGLGLSSRQELNEPAVAITLVLSAYRHDNGFHSPSFYKESIPMEVVQVSSDVVVTTRRSLDAHKISGPDELHPKILKILAPFLAKSLAYLFNLSLAPGQVPYDWRTATVCTIFKKSRREIPGNCRPFAPVLRSSEAISKSQQGSLPKKSCLIDLLVVEEKVTLITDSGDTVDVVFLDFS